MGSSRFRTGIALRSAALFLTFAAIAWMTMHTQWYVCIALGVAMALIQIALFMQFATYSSREIARFLDAVSFDDALQSFSGLRGDSAYHELGSAMTRVLDRLRVSRTQREEQARYFQALLAHVPVALVSINDSGGVHLLNMAARRLFETTLVNAAQFARYGDGFAASIDALRPGATAILRMERTSGALQLKAAATGLTLGGERRRIVSLQNIESELSARELAAWQTVIRVMSHEVMNSLTPVSSLAATAHDLVRNMLVQMPEGDPNFAALTDAEEALETVARRSEGLLHFVQNHRRLTKRLVTQVEMLPIRRVFARLNRLLAADLSLRGIELAATVEPETLEIAADSELLDQALINLVRNAMEALANEPLAQIHLAARRDSDGHVVIVVADNGPGIDPAQRDKIFVPFFTTKRQGTGVGLTLVRQIAVAHGGAIDVSDTPGGGATFTLRL
jgi:nitrogen fixation/metabolism regulation signal transduction histidine kinase